MAGPDFKNGIRPTATQAARFLAQSALSSTPAEIDAVVRLGYGAWIDAQLATPRQSTFWDWLHAKGYNKQPAGREDGFDAMIWSSLITGDDHLRQRVALALFNMLVVSIEGSPVYWPPFGVAAYMDILWNGAFGTYRELLDQVSRNAVMANYLTFAGSKKASANGSVPDENYARELMQLFTIGLYQLNIDGTRVMRDGKPVETYSQDDITGLARVFTGWHWDRFDQTTPDLFKRPLVQIPTDHELGEKSFLGTVIKRGTDGVASLRLALDAIVAHPNVAPFVSKHLIQNLVTSNPSPSYIARVARVFENNGQGVRGDLKAVVRAILLDAEARADPQGNSFGKLRDPVLRFVSWARLFHATSPSEKWPIEHAEWLGRRIGRAPSVFNDFRPGYSPPNSDILRAGLVAPEFQITDEPNVMSYINFMIVIMRDGSGDFKANYAEWLALQANSTALVARLNLALAANQISAATIRDITRAVDSQTNPMLRIYTATTLVMASPEYLVLK